MEGTLDDKLNQIKVALCKHPNFVEVAWKDYTFNLDGNKFFAITLHNNDFMRLNSKSFENYKNMYYLGCGVDATPIFGQAKNMIFQDYSLNFEGVDYGAVWPNLMCILEQAGLISNLKSTCYKDNHSQFEFEVDGKRKSLFYYRGDYTKSTHPDLKKADYIHNAASLISVPIKLISGLKVGCTIYTDDFGDVATNEPKYLKEIGLEKVGERMWQKARHVDAEQIEEFNSRIYNILHPPRHRRIIFLNNGN